MRKYKGYIGLFYILAVFFIVPSFTKGSFNNLSQNKVEVFYCISGIAFAAYFLFSIISDIREKKENTEKTSYVPGLIEIAFIAFIFSNLLSLVLSGNMAKAFYGVPGFGMGLLSILIMCISSLYISKNVALSEPVIHLIAVSSVFPVMLTILNRLGFDPLKLYFEGEHPQSHLYVSTLGNYSTFSSYMSIMIPIICFMSFFANNVKVRICYFVHFMICVISIILAGTTTIRLIAIMVFFMTLLLKKRPVTVTSGKLTICICIVFLAYLALILYGIGNPDFGNGRGFIWKLSLEMFQSFSIRQKIFGVGPNCYMYALTDFLLTDESYLFACNERFGNLALTSAHSEYLDYLVNSGILGFVSYLFLIVAVLKSYFDNLVKDKVTDMAFLCVVSYLLMVTMNFSTVVATPYFFIFLGVLHKNERI